MKDGGTMSVERVSAEEPEGAKAALVCEAGCRRSYGSHSL
jgi:hypothetical protein